MKREHINKIIYIVSAIILTDVMATCNTDVLTIVDAKDSSSSSLEVACNEIDVNAALFRLTNRG